MPFYEYQCADCAHELEALQKISADPLIDCPACGHPALKRKISAAAFRLKGGGWYETDFKSSGKRNIAGEGGEKGASSKSEGGSESKAADKPAEKKTETKADSGSKSGGSTPATAA